MSRFLIFLGGAVLGAIAGGALIFYFFTGAPRAAQVPGNLLKAPDANAPQSATATVVLRQDFFNRVLAQIFRDLDAPAFPLDFDNGGSSLVTNYLLQGDCPNRIELKQEGSGAVTGVSFADNKITAPLAFRGNVGVLGSCVEFGGWANGKLDLYFDEQQKVVNGRLNIETVNLDNIPAAASPYVTQFVQNSLNRRVNPIPILRGEHIALQIPVQVANGTLTARLADVRSDIKDNALNLYLTYDLNGARNK